MAFDSIAAANCATGLNRSAGFLASARWSAPATAAGTAGRKFVIGWGVRHETLTHDRFGGRAGERWLSAEHFVQHAREAIQIAASIDLRVTQRLFGTHVQRRSHRHAGLGDARTAGSAERTRDAKVGDHRVSALEEDIVGFDVAMHDAARVSIAQRVGDFARDAQGVGDRKLLLAVEAIAQRLALHQRHHVVQEVARAAGIVERQDVRMPKIRRRFDFAEKTLRANHGAELRQKHLDRDLALVLQVFGEVDGGHATLPELALDAVAALQRRGESISLRGSAHGDSARECPSGMTSCTLHASASRIGMPSTPRRYGAAPGPSTWRQ